jgi:hypothetical protein
MAYRWAFGAQRFRWSCGHARGCLLGARLLLQHVFESKVWGAWQEPSRDGPVMALEIGIIDLQKAIRVDARSTLPLLEAN